MVPTMEKVFVFGNPDLTMDALPLRILPRLREEFPAVDFVVLDPHEEWSVPLDMLIVDTVLGVKSVHVFHGLTQFAPSARVSLHDFDAFTNLRYLQKLGKLRDATVIGVPPDISEDDAFRAVTDALHALL